MYNPSCPPVTPILSGLVKRQGWRAILFKGVKVNIMEITAFNLYVGQRVKYITSRHPYPRHQYTSVTPNMVMRLFRDDSPFITCAITRIEQFSGICLRPDGWPLPESISPFGFCSAVEKWIEPLENTAVEYHGVLCARNGAELTREQVRDEIQSYLSSHLLPIQQ